MTDLEALTFHLHYFSDDNVLTEKRTVKMLAGSRNMTKYFYEDKEKRQGYVDVYEHRAGCKDEFWLIRRELKTLEWYDENG